MIPANYSDKAIIVDILTQSFDSNKSVNYAVKQDKKRIQRIKRLMNYSFETCWHFGEIYLTDDKKGVVLIILPEKKRTTFKGIIEDLKLTLFSIGITRVSKILERESRIKKYHPEKYMYLWYLGVDPQYQGKGVGSSLLKDIIDLGQKRKLPIYLETSTERNLPLYQRFNFKLYQELDFNSTLFMFKREPD